MVSPGEAPPGATIGKYVLEGELARGGMGVVYRALDPVLRRPCALKLMLDGGVDPSGVERFLREARALARLRHPGIVDIYDAGVHGGQPFLVMELVQGGSLAALVRAKGALEVRRALELLDRVARAIDAAHAEGILHRDLKPANVLLDADGAPRVTDFGLARDTTGREQAITLGDQMLGTPNYMAPEQAGGENHLVGPRSDVYGLGAVLFELVTGKPPFEGTTSLNIVAKLLRGPPSARFERADLPADVEFIIKRAMATRPEDRYDSAAALAADVRRHLEGRPIEARPAGVVERAWKLARRHRALASLAAGVLGLACVGTALGAQTLALRRAQAAAAAEERGRAAADPAAAEPSLREAVLLAPGRASAWRALARALLERGADDEAREALARAGDDEGTRGERSYLRGRLAEVGGDAFEQAAAYREAAEAGCREPDLPRRLARASARDATARGWHVAAEDAWWDLVRADPEDAEALRTIVAGWLDASDVHALTRGWETALGRLGDDGHPGFQAVARADEQDAIADLRGGDSAALAARVRAAIAATLFRSRQIQDATTDLLRSPRPLLSEAVRASSLALGDVPLAEWAQVAAVTTWADGAAPALTLLERAHLLGQEDVPALQALARDGRGSLLRAAVALATALAATRQTPLPAAHVTVLLEPLERDPDARVQACARDATDALAALGHPRASDRPIGPGGVLLAQRLRRAPEGRGPLARAELAEGDPWAAASLLAADRATGTASARLHVARAEDVIERGRATTWREDARAALALALRADASGLAARALDAQLLLLAGQDAPALAALPADDPVALAAAARRVEFTRAFRVCALDGGAGALRVVVRPGAEPPDRAFDILAPVVEARPDALRTIGVAVLRTRFTFPELHSLTIVGGPIGDARSSFTIRAHSPVMGGPGGYAFHTSAGHECWIEVDDTVCGKVPRSNAVRDGVDLYVRRIGLDVASDGETLVAGQPRARIGHSRGYVDVEWGWAPGPFDLRALTIVGRWDGRLDAWPRPPRATPLRPAPGASTVLAERIERAMPGTLDLLRRNGAQFIAKGAWVGGERDGQVVAVPSHRRDVSIRARVQLDLREGVRHVGAGVALRASDAPDCVWLGLTNYDDTNPELRANRVWLQYQRGSEWNKPIRSALGDLSGTVLSLERRGDFVVARSGPDPGRLQDLGEAIYFPFDGPVDACLFGRRTGRPSEGRATFSEVEVLVPE